MFASFLSLLKFVAASCVVTSTWTLTFQLQPCQGFVAPQKSSKKTPIAVPRHNHQQQSLFQPQSNTHLNSFLGNLFGGGANKETGPKTLIDLPASTVKIGALRFLIQIFLVGEQNKPVPGSWRTMQGEEGDLQVYYSDGTGMFSIDLKEYNIKVTRYGERPSLQYVLQESLLLHGFLDELTTVALEVDDIEQDKRLLQLKDDTAIATARESLLARQEKL